MFFRSIQVDVLTKNCQALRQQRRELSRASLTEVSPVASSGKPDLMMINMIKTRDTDSAHSRLPGSQNRGNVHVRSKQCY